jgi:6-phospho-beta-glucosidase
VTTVARGPAVCRRCESDSTASSKCVETTSWVGGAAGKSAIVCVRSRLVKICVVGGGSTYTPELVDGILRRHDRLPASELVLLDPNEERLEIVGRFARRMCEASGSDLQVRWTGDAAEALAGSEFVVTQLRVGGQEARHRDELAGRAFGLIGQETTGIGGFAKALRTIPVMLAIAREVERSAPGATLVNFTNPAGLITELLRRHTSLRVVGLCNVPWNMQIEVANALGCEFADVDIDYVGLNHLSWARGFRVKGEERTSEVLARYRELLVNQAAGDDEPGFAPETISLLGAVPNYYDLYYYETAAMLRHQEHSPTRASQVMAIEARLLERYADASLREKPEELMERGGAYYSESAAALMADVHADAGSVQVVNVRNDGAIPNLPDDVVVEMPARIGAHGATAVPTGPLRADFDALVRSAKDYELLTIEAALTGDRSLAELALMTNPLGPDASLAPRVWERLCSDNEGLFGALDG